MKTNPSFTLITGASSGIGYELAKEFARHGHHLILTARRQDKLQRLAEEIQKTFTVEAVVVPCDLAHPLGAKNLYLEIQRLGLSVDTLVNNAGFGDLNPFATANWKKNQEMLQVNILSLTELTHLFLPAMIKNKNGKILNVASTAAFQAGPNMSVYYASKAYVLSFSEGLAEELTSQGITVTALCPGPTQSGFQQTADMGDIALFNTLKIPTSASVAKYGYQALQEQKTIAIHGVINKIGAISTKITPRCVTRKLVKKLQEKSV